MRGLYAVINNMDHKIVSTHRTLNMAILARHKLNPRYIESYIIGIRISSHKLYNIRIITYQPLDANQHYVVQITNPIRMDDGI